MPPGREILAVDSATRQEFRIRCGLDAIPSFFWSGFRVYLMQRGLCSSLSPSTCTWPCARWTASQNMLQQALGLLAPTNRWLS